MAAMTEKSQSNASEVEPSPLEEELAPERSGPLRRLLESLRPAGWARVAIVGVGAAILVYGLVNAWRSKDVTPLVVVGAVLLVFGLVFPAEFGFSWGDARAFARRAGKRLEEAEQAASPDELRNEVAQLRSELQSLSTAASATTLRTSRPRFQGVTAGFDELAKPKAWHSFRGLSSVALTLRTWASRDRLTCTVTTPTGDSWSTTADLPLVLAPVQTATVVYPDEFRGSSPLVPGNYLVEWRSGISVGTEAAGSLVRVLAGMKNPPAATDSFTITAARATGGQQEEPRTAETRAAAQVSEPATQAES